MQSFHDDPTLAELLPADRRERLTGLLARLADAPLQLSDTFTEGASPVEFNLQSLAWLQCPRPAQQEAAAALLEFVLYYVGKYRLAANMHRDAAEANFAELQEQNEALRESEQRYRDLSRRLQERVEQQVGVINETQRQLYESARLRSIGQLAAGVAHEINNPIGFIASNLQVAAGYVDDLERLPCAASAADLLRDFRALIDESASGASRVAAIVADLKTFSNIDRSEFTNCDAGRLLVAACNLLQAKFGHDLAVDLALAEGVTLMGYPARLSQAFYNLLDNAARSLAPGGRIRVASARSGNVLEVRIEDDGGGIPAEVLPRIFDPFFSTRGVGSGIGLGLTVAREIISAHRGDIRVDSEAGRGTCVTLRLPLE